MRKKIVLCAVLFTLSLNLILPPKQSSAAETNVKVTLPAFALKLNGNKVENQYREYPLLVYKGITYFPMTWYDSRLLGLQTKWTQNDGLEIVKGNVTSSYVPNTTNHKNLSSFKATIPTFKITINGETVDNSKEDYPLLNYKDVIYFPLTWKFAHDKFEWEYAWDDSEGLSITSNNVQVVKVNLPKSAGDNDVAVYKGYYYFTETAGGTNQVYKVPVNNTSNKELVYSYEVDSKYGLNKNLKFEIRDKELWFSYHLGGATMGSDEYGRINDKGIATIEHQGYLDFKNTSNGTLIINQSVPPSGNNLILVPAGQQATNGKAIGNPKLIYGWHKSVNGTSSSLSTNNSTTIIGDDVYVLGSSISADKEDLNKVYKINVKTNETEKIINAEVSNFKVLNNKLYYLKDADLYLYSSDMDGTNEQKISDNKVSNWYDEIDGNVYYTVGNTMGQLNLYKAEPSKEDTIVLKESLESVQLVNDKLICKLAAGEDYGVKVLDKSGNLHLAITDQVSNVFADNDVILIVSTEDKSIKLVK
ncbi:DUF5050 domain-containing protein [Paenibacillus albiflavus]|uniref:DUF5050 domain-containing protein n=1 Tax=Paenibacillus albiflavus TaxID=2545760 RepID=A0A4R4E931_9BACL|nr:DUF5050 domain-containing protein [Paenibacillus albiflavus]TCZ75677.1 DUF5050 domain-containing protein [Paenibacillus albiflavus]